MHSVVWMPVARRRNGRRNTPEDCEVPNENWTRWLVKPTEASSAVESPDFHRSAVSLIKFRSQQTCVRISRLASAVTSADSSTYGGYWSTLLGAFCASSQAFWMGAMERSPFETTGIRFRMLAGDNLRGLRSSTCFPSCGHDHRTVAEDRNKKNRIWDMWPAYLFGLSNSPRNGWERRRLAVAPDQLLKIWPGATLRAGPSNPFLYFARTYGVHVALFFH